MDPELSNRTLASGIYIMGDLPTQQLIQWVYSGKGHQYDLGYLVPHVWFFLKRKKN